MDPSLDLFSAVNSYTPKSHHPSLCQCRLFSGAGAEGPSCGFRPDTAAQHRGNMWETPTGRVVSLALSPPCHKAVREVISTILLLCLPWKEGPPGAARVKLDGLLELLGHCTAARRSASLCTTRLLRNKTNLKT